ncbi:MAG: class I SAM-dependent methyltransferase [Dactylosporangium sp.]|nr:class I SAM-dependent methyltransferase [Dactylosporangium sp.]NNJ60551.1 class I SAM-dependent methyltransferase [Dactylosporangium sp.]
MTEQPQDHAAINRAYGDGRAGGVAGTGQRNWAATEPIWGIWDIPQSRLPVLPDDVAGADVVELGCGTAYVSAWLARRGARPVGLDSSRRHLAAARALQERHALRFPLHLGDAEATPFADASFDLAISEFGASVWHDPGRWIPEAARILRPAGQLIFMRNSTLLTESSPPRGELIGLLRASGFVLEDLLEARAPAGVASVPGPVTPAWAAHWPAEEVWLARRIGTAGLGAVA